MNHRCVASIKKQKQNSLDTGIYNWECYVMSKLWRNHRYVLCWYVDPLLGHKYVSSYWKARYRNLRPVHREPRDSVLALATGHISISLGLVFRWAGSPFTSFTAGSALLKALPHLLTAFHSLFPAHTSLSFWTEHSIKCGNHLTSVLTSHEGRWHLVGRYSTRRLLWKCLWR